MIGLSVSAKSSSSSSWLPGNIGNYKATTEQSVTCPFLQSSKRCLGVLSAWPSQTALWQCEPRLCASSPQGGVPDSFSPQAATSALCSLGCFSRIHMSLPEHSIQSTGMQGPHIAAKCWPGLTFNAPVDAQHFAGLLLAATTHKKKI